MLIKPQGYTIKKTVELTRDQMRMFHDFEQMLNRMGLQFWMRCRRCAESGEQIDGVWGNNDSTASQYVVECSCTKRVYAAADAPLH